MFGGRIIPIVELEHLGNLLSHLVVQRENSKPVEFLNQTLHDMRVMISRIIATRLLPHPPSRDWEFIEHVSEYLSAIHEEIVEEDLDGEFCDYCIGEIISSLQKAVELKSSSAIILDQKKFLAMVPIFESFDLNLRPLLRLVKPDSKKNGRLPF